MPTLLDRGKLKHPDLPNEIPIDYIVGRVRTQIQEPPNQINPFANRIIILEAGTATGKSITVAPELYIMTQGLAGYSRKTVICTQPRILTAQEIPHELHDAPYFARHNFKFRLGENLGTQSSASVEKGDYGLLFATLGVLEMQLSIFSAKQIIDRYSIIVIDEAHERQLIFDSTISMVKKFFVENREHPRLPYLVLMSATFDVNKYAKFFGVGDENIIRVEGFSFPIEERWPQTSVPVALTAAYDEIVKCINEEVTAHLADPQRAKTQAISDNRILLFVTGAAEGKKIKERMKAEGWAQGKLVQGLRVIAPALYVDGPSVKKITADYLKLTGGNESAPSLLIEVLVVNAVAETGLSLNNLRYVIDCGWSKESEFNPTYNITSALISKPAAQSRIRQRRGRVGRKKPGIFIPLYTKATYDALEVIQMPEILKLDPTPLILNVIIMNGQYDGRIGEFLMDVPSKTAVKYALDKLQLTGFIDHELRPTPFARIGSKIVNTVGVEGATMIMSGLVYGASIDDLIVISVMMKYASSPTSFTGHTEARKEKFVEQKNKYETMRRTRKPEEYEALWSTVIDFGGKRTDVFYKLRALLADEFIEALINFRAFEATFDKIDPTLTPSKKYAALDKWCTKVFIVTDQMLEIYHDYIEVKSKLCMCGINITQNRELDFVRGFRFIDTSAVDDQHRSSMDRIIAIKLCINAGYKFNLATYDDAAGSYRINYGGLAAPPVTLFSNDPQVRIDWQRFGIAQKYMPERILFYKSEIMYNANKKRHELALKGISVISGYL